MLSWKVQVSSIRSIFNQSSGTYDSTNGIEFISLEMPDNGLYLFPDDPKSRQSYNESQKKQMAATFGKHSSRSRKRFSSRDFIPSAQGRPW